MKRCVIYTRKSVPFRLDINYNTLESQEDICKRFIRQHSHKKWSCRGTYCDAGVSGGTTSRAGLQRLLADARAGSFDCVVVFKFDRLARKIRDFICLLDELSECGVDVVSVTENYDFSGPMGKAQRVMMGVFAEWERDNLRERCREWAESARMKGYYLGGLPPFGYEWKDRVLEPETSQAAEVQEMFRQYAEGKGAHKLAGELNKRRVPKRARGGKAPAPWCSNNVLGILSNPVYAGWVRCRGALYQGIHKALISQDLWEAVQTRLLANREQIRRRLNGKGPGYAYPLRGVLICGVCGRRMRGMFSPGSAKRLRYYACPTRQYGGMAGCHNIWLRADKVEKLLWQWVEQNREDVLPLTEGAQQVFRTVFEKLVYYGHSGKLTLLLHPKATGSAASQEVSIPLPWLAAQDKQENTPTQQPSRQAVDVAHALLLEDMLCAGVFPSVQALARELQWSYHHVLKLLRLLNKPATELEKILLEQQKPLTH